MKLWILVIVLSLLCPLAKSGAAAFEPTRTVTFEELRKAHPKASIEEYDLNGVNVVILKLYFGSGFIRQTLHVFQKYSNGSMNFKATLVLPANKSSISVVGDRVIVKCQGQEVAVLTKDLFGRYFLPSKDYPEES